MGTGRNHVYVICLKQLLIGALKEQMRKEQWLLLPAPVNSYIYADLQGGLYLIKSVLQIVAAEAVSLTARTKTDSSAAKLNANLELLALQVHAAYGHINWVSVKKRLSQGGDKQVGGLTPQLITRLLSIPHTFL